jgi:hypothetical protein
MKRVGRIVETKSNTGKKKTQAINADLLDWLLAIDVSLS